MSQSLSQFLVRKLIDWLIAICVVGLLLWFIVTQPVFVSSSVKDSQNIDVQSLKNHVQLLTNSYAPRTINHNNLNNTSDYIFQQFETVGMPEFQNVTTLSKQYRNVSLQLGPDTQEVYVIGAHYDAEDDSINTEGNASGVATLIELAKKLAENNQKLNVGVILVAYPLSLNQSDSLVNTGSYFHSLSLKKMNKKVRLMISLDSVGQIYSENMTNNYTYKFMDLIYPSNDNHLNLVGRLKDVENIRELKRGFNSASSLSLYSQTLFENYNKTESSDHINYWKQGYPAVLISDAFNKKTFKSGHSRTNPTERMDYEKMGMLVNSLYQVVVQTQASNEDRTHLARRSRNRQIN